MKNDIKEIEELKHAVIRKHFNNYSMVMHDVAYRGDYKRGDAMEAAIDKKIIFYVQLGISADQLTDKK